MLMQVNLEAAGWWYVVLPEEDEEIVYRHGVWRSPRSCDPFHLRCLQVFARKGRQQKQGRQSR